jgi:hypothetical protein
MIVLKVQDVMLDRVSWLIEGRIVMAEFSGLLSLEDFFQVREQFETLIPRSHPRSFYIIYHTSARTGIDWRFSDLAHVRDLGYKHPRLRRLVVVDAKPHPLASVVGRMAVHFHGLSIQITHSQEEAMAHLYKIDATLRTSLSR